MRNEQSFGDQREKERKWDRTEEQDNGQHDFEDPSCATVRHVVC